MDNSGQTNSSEVEIDSSADSSSPQPSPDLRSKRRGTQDFKEYCRDLILEKFRSDRNGFISEVETAIPKESPDEWNFDISTNDLASSTEIFRNLEKDEEGLVDVRIGVDYFVDSGLRPFELAQIWYLADITRDAKLDYQEFAIALSLVKTTLAGKKIPENLSKSAEQLSKSHSTNSLPMLEKSVQDERKKLGSVVGRYGLHSSNSVKSALSKFSLSVNSLTTLFAKESHESVQTRPSNLPPKSPEENARHLKEVERMEKKIKKMMEKEEKEKERKEQAQLAREKRLQDAIIFWKDVLANCMKRDIYQKRSRCGGMVFHPT